MRDFLRILAPIALSIGVVVAIIFVLVAASFIVHAHDPFTGLRNANGTSCCSGEGPASDCKTTRTQFGPNGHLQAFIDERWARFASGAASFAPGWVDVPDDKILPIEQNPVAGEVVCWLPHLGVICFLPGRGT